MKQPEPNMCAQTRQVGPSPAPADQPTVGSRVCARSRGDRLQRTRQRGPESSTTGQPQQQARRSACDATQDLLVVVEGRVLSCAAGSDRVLQSKGEAITDPPCLALNLGRVKEDPTCTHQIGNKGQPQVPRRLSFLSIVVATGRASQG